MRLIPAIIVPLSLLVGFSGCQPERKQATGYTQGTTYQVIYYTDREDLQYQIDSLLLAFDRIFSTYQENSYISRWNRSEAGLQQQPALFQELLESAIRIHGITDGAFDLTLGSLTDLWFGKDNQPGLSVDSNQVDSIRQKTGMRYITYDGMNYAKSESGLRLDVDAIAQGLSVDVVSRYLKSQGVFNHLVEIGGEIRVSGTKPDGQAWVVGIDRPVSNNPERETILSMALRNQALATSGNYRKFFEKNGKRYGHTLDPTTGYPAETDVLSATVIATDCMTADALATACMALGFDRAHRLIMDDESLSGVLIYVDSLGVQTWVSPELEGQVVMRHSE